MPPNPNLPSAPKPYFFHGPRSPHPNRPTVHSPLFTHHHHHRNPKSKTKSPSPAISFLDWNSSHPQPPSLPPPSLPSSSSSLSPLARHLLHIFHLHHLRWSPSLYRDLLSLRRIPPSLLSEILRIRPPLPPPLLSRFFHFASSQPHFPLPFSSFNSLAHSLYASHRPAAADQVPDLMLSLGKNPSEKQLEILIRLHSLSARPRRLFALYRKMRIKFGIRPRVFLYNRILEALVKFNCLDLALSVYDDMRSDGVKEEAVTFMVLNKGLFRAGKVEEGMELLGRMRAEVCRPDVFAYTALLKVLVGERDLDGCLRVWEEMARDGVEGDVMAYSTIVGGLCKVERVEKGVEVFREMKAKGLLVERAIYGALVEGFVAGGKVGDGFEVF